MDKTQVHPSTKDAAIRQLGVVSTKQRKALAERVEFVRVQAGRQLLARGSFAPTVIVGVGGGALVANANGNVTHLEDPYVIDSWAADDRRIADLTVVTDTESTLVLIDWSQRDEVLAAIPALAQLSANTRREIDQAEAQLIDLTAATRSLQKVH